MDKEKYIETVLKEVKFHYDHQEIEKELENHIYERSQYLQSKGMTAEIAETEAVQRMGDPEAMGKELNKAHNPWVGYVWLASKIFAVCLLIAAVWFGVPEAYDDIKDYIQEPTPLEHFSHYGDVNTLSTIDTNEKLMLDGYEIHFTEATIIKHTQYDYGGYYMALFYEHVGDTGKDIYEFFDEKGYTKNMFLDKNWECFAKERVKGDRPYILVKEKQKYVLLWIPDFSNDTIYVNFDVFGQQDKCEIDLSRLFEKIESKEAQL